MESKYLDETKSRALEVRLGLTLIGGNHARSFQHRRDPRDRLLRHPRGLRDRQQRDAARQVPRACDFMVEIVSITTVVGSTTTVEPVNIMGNNVTVAPAVTITLQSTSPSGAVVGAAGSVVMRVATKASSYSDEIWTGIRYRIVCSNGSATFANITIKRMT
ncbi:hypothetical protein HY224_00420, partial [Candidatus Uhrbacteria bacterium]|nr:hypothetical protein [Candidatus Uhrbacteria bacterium]